MREAVNNDDYIIGPWYQSSSLDKQAFMFIECILMQNDEQNKPEIIQSTYKLPVSTHKYNNFSTAGDNKIKCSAIK